MIGEVDLLGLDEFGQNPGLSPLYGALIGAGVANLTTIAVEQFADPGQWVFDNSDAVGFGVGLAASAAMYALPSTRHAALASAAAVALSAGLRAVAKLLVGSPKAEAAAAAAPGVSGYFGDAMIQPTLPVYGAQLGLPQANWAPYVVGGPQPTAHGVLGEAEIQRVPQVYGSGLAGPQLGHQPPVDLVGLQSASQQSASLLGAPLTSSLASHYGSNIFNHG
jgi:hypothetical protein